MRYAKQSSKTRTDAFLLEALTGGVHVRHLDADVPEAGGVAVAIVGGPVGVLGAVIVRELEDCIPVQTSPYVSGCVRVYA